MKREAIEDDYKDADVWYNDILVMSKGVVLDEKWWENKIQLGKYIHKKKIIL